MILNPRNNLRAILLLIVVLSMLPEGCSKHNPLPPILILAQQNNFGTYTGEMLKAEGFNEFIIDSLGSGRINRSYLNEFDLVVVAEPVMDMNVSAILREYVEKGGNIIGFEPEDQLDDLFGIGINKGPGNSGYLAIDTASEVGNSLTSNLIQVHVPHRKYLPGKGEVVAWFRDRTDPDKRYPAVVKYKYGKGHTAAILYNMTKNIVLTRQGNPSLAGIEKDGIPGLRAMDMFTDGWVDTSNSIINQADEQMTLLSHLIEGMASSKKPLPRLWYFPDTLRSLITLTNDGEFRGEDDFEKQFRDIDSLGAKMSLYILETGKVTGLWARKWSEKGFEISGHPDDTENANSPSWRDMDSVQTAKIKEISELYGLKMSTVVNHWFVWCGNEASGRQEFAAQAEIEAGHGLSMDINYAHYDNNSSQGHFLGPLGRDQGNFTGSGLPMRFALSTGKTIDIFQHLNNVYDQQYTENHDPEGFFQCFKGLIDRSLNDEVYSFISIKAHNDEYYFSKTPLLRMIAYANSKGVPVWTAEDLLDFLRTRDGSEISDLKWDKNNLSFRLGTSIHDKSHLTFMVPFLYDNIRIKQVKIDGSTVPFIIRSLKGMTYAFSTVHSGVVYSVQVSYGK
jgi:hypothetical protein